MMIPMSGQYEQRCNALSASRLGVPVIGEIDEAFGIHLSNWLNDDKKIMVDFPDETAQVVDNLIKTYAKA
jgi:hypothetical protein